MLTRWSAAAEGPRDAFCHSESAVNVAGAQRFKLDNVVNVVWLKTLEIYSVQSMGLTACVHEGSALIFVYTCNPLKMICNDFLVVKVNCWSYVFNTMKYMWILRNVKNKNIVEKNVWKCAPMIGK